MTTEPELRQIDRAVLEWLADRSHGAYEANSTAEWIHRSVPAVQAALSTLRRHGLVRYYPNHRSHAAGTWTVTPEGLKETNRAVIS